MFRQLSDTLEKQANVFPDHPTTPQDTGIVAFCDQCWLSKTRHTTWLVEAMVAGGSCEVRSLGAPDVVPLKFPSSQI